MQIGPSSPSNWLPEQARDAPVQQLEEQERTSVDSNASSPANSFASIDTISDAGSDRDVDAETEKNWRMRKLLKYSRWKSKVASGGDEKNNSALERRMAKQERKLQELEERQIGNSLEDRREALGSSSKLQVIEEGTEVSFNVKEILTKLTGVIFAQR